MNIVPGYQVLTNAIVENHEPNERRAVAYSLKSCWPAPRVALRLRSSVKTIAANSSATAP